MTTGPGTGRVSTSEAYRDLASIADNLSHRAPRAPSFGVTEERGPGGVVVPLFRCEVPVCDEYPTSEKAFAAMLDYRQRFRADVEVDTLTTDLAASVDKGKS
jgi:hypothetical protein